MLDNTVSVLLQRVSVRAGSPVDSIRLPFTEEASYRITERHETAKYSLAEIDEYGSVLVIHKAVELGVGDTLVFTNVSWERSRGMDGSIPR